MDFANGSTLGMDKSQSKRLRQTRAKTPKSCLADEAVWFDTALDEELEHHMLAHRETRTESDMHAWRSLSM